MTAPPASPPDELPLVVLFIRVALDACGVACAALAVPTRLALRSLVSVSRSLCPPPSGPRQRLASLLGIPLRLAASCLLAASALLPAAAACCLAPESAGANSRTAGDARYVEFVLLRRLAVACQFLGGVFDVPVLAPAVCLCPLTPWRARPLARALLGSHSSDRRRGRCLVILCQQIADAVTMLAGALLSLTWRGPLVWCDVARGAGRRAVWHQLHMFVLDVVDVPHAAAAAVVVCTLWRALPLVRVLLSCSHRSEMRAAIRLQFLRWLADIPHPRSAEGGGV
eukprot:m51a1_g6347 hypothetical protein (283) ;mRNA; f:70584-71503